MSAEMFERDLVPAIFAPWAEELADLAAPRPGEHVLDLACGTGIVARVVRERIGRGRLVGLDFDPAMLRVAESICPDVEWVEGDALALPFGDAEFDLIVCQQGLQFVPDRPRCLAEAHRVLRSGGRLTFSVWTPLENSPGHAAVFAELGQRLGAEYARPVGWSLTDAGEIESLVRDAGFAEVGLSTQRKVSRFPSARSFVESLLSGASKITRAALAKLPEDSRAAFVGAVAARLAEFEGEDGVGLPMESHLVAARRGE